MFKEKILADITEAERLYEEMQNHPTRRGVEYDALCHEYLMLHHQIRAQILQFKRTMRSEDDKNDGEKQEHDGVQSASVCHGKTDASGRTFKDAGNHLLQY